MHTRHIYLACDSNLWHGAIGKTQEDLNHLVPPLPPAFKILIRHLLPGYTHLRVSMALKLKLPAWLLWDGMLVLQTR